MSATRKMYTAEGKREAGGLLADHGYGVSAAACHVGWHATRRRPGKRHLAHAGENALPGHGRFSPEQAARQRLRQENTRLRMARECVKQAARFFAHAAR
jgi:transposase-like protein